MRNKVAAGMYVLAIGLGASAAAQQAGLNPGAGGTVSQPSIPEPGVAQPAGGQPGGANLEAVPEGQVRIAIDTDNDGRVDRYETIDVFELEQARRNSAERRRNAQGATSDGLIRVSGTIQKLKSIKLSGVEGDQQIARIKEADGENVRVHLGSTADLASWNLKDGDTITVIGSVGLINDRPVLVAHRIQAGDKTVNVTLPDDRRLQRIHAQVLSVRNAKFKGREGEQLIANLRLLDGGQVPAILGPTSALGALKIHDGTTLELLVRPGRLNNEPALVAEQVRHNDQVVPIPQPASEGAKGFQTRPGSETGTTTTTKPGAM